MHAFCLYFFRFVRNCLLQNHVTSHFSFKGFACDVSNLFYSIESFRDSYFSAKHSIYLHLTLLSAKLYSDKNSQWDPVGHPKNLKLTFIYPRN